MLWHLLLIHYSPPCALGSLQSSAKSSCNWRTLRSTNNRKPHSAVSPMATTTSGESSLAGSPRSLCARRTKMTIVATSPSNRLNCGPYTTTITTAPSKVAYMHCTRIRQGQAGVSAITRRPTAFIVAHELGWASTRSRPGSPIC